MADRVCTRFIDDDGLDIGCHLVTKEYVLEAYPELVSWMKTPALWNWGCYTGDNTITIKSSPVQTISNGTNWKSVDRGYEHAGAIKTDGTLWLWGGRTGLGENYGQLGDNSIISRSSPVQTMSAGTNWKSVSTASKNTAAIKTDGSLWLWGCNAQGQLGNNSIIHTSSPIQTVSNVTTWKQVSISSLHAAAIKTDGALWTWGEGGSGLLGNNSIIDRSSPVQTISGGTNWKSTDASLFGTAGIKTDGTLWLWGLNSYGLLADNTIIDKSTPIQTISGGTNWKQISLGIVSNAAAIKTDGTLWTWGTNTDGALGNNAPGLYDPYTAIVASSPVQTISGGTNWKQVCVSSSTYTTVAAIKTDGTLWTWGRGYSFGNNIRNSSPVQTSSGGTGWRQVSLGLISASAIRDEGEF